MELIPFRSRGSSAFQKRLRETLDQIRITLAFSSEQWRDLLKATPAEEMRIQEGRAFWGLQHLENLCEKLDLSMEQLLLGQIDLKILADRYGGKLSLYPDRYSIPEQLCSVTRAVRVVTAYLDTFYGTQKSRNILRRLDVHPNCLFNLEAPVSSQLTEDILQELKQDGLSPQDFLIMGTFSSEVSRKTTLGQALAQTPSSRSLYVKAFDEFGDLLDRVCRYRLLFITETNGILEVTIREETAEIFKRNLVGTQENCYFRQGVARSLLGLHQRKIAEIRESQCMYKGDPTCLYHLSWGS